MLERRGIADRCWSRNSGALTLSSVSNWTGASGDYRRRASSGCATPAPRPALSAGSGASQCPRAGRGRSAARRAARAGAVDRGPVDRRPPRTHSCGQALEHLRPVAVLAAQRRHPRPLRRAIPGRDRSGRGSRARPRGTRRAERAPAVASASAKRTGSRICRPQYPASTTPASTACPVTVDTHVTRGAAPLPTPAAAAPNAPSIGAISPEWNACVTRSPWLRIPAPVQPRHHRPHRRRRPRHHHAPRPVHRRHPHLPPPACTAASPLAPSPRPACTAAIAPPRGSAPISRPRAATSRAAASTSSTPATHAAANSPTLCPTTTAGSTPHARHMLRQRPLHREQRHLRVRRLRPAPPPSPARTAPHQPVLQLPRHRRRHPLHRRPEHPAPRVQPAAPSPRTAPLAPGTGRRLAAAARRGRTCPPAMRGAAPPVAPLASRVPRSARRSARQWRGDARDARGPTRRSEQTSPRSRLGRVEGGARSAPPARRARACVFAERVSTCTGRAGADGAAGPTRARLPRPRARWSR